MRGTKWHKVSLRVTQHHGSVGGCMLRVTVAQTDGDRAGQVAGLSWSCRVYLWPRHWARPLAGASGRWPPRPACWNPSSFRSYMSHLSGALCPSGALSRLLHFPHFQDSTILDFHTTTLPSSNPLAPRFRGTPLRLHTSTRLHAFCGFTSTLVAFTLPYFHTALGLGWFGSAGLGLASRWFRVGLGWLRVG